MILVLTLAEFYFIQTNVGFTSLHGQYAKALWRAAKNLTKFWINAIFNTFLFIIFGLWKDAFDNFKQHVCRGFLFAKGRTLYRFRTVPWSKTNLNAMLPSSYVFLVLSSQYGVQAFDELGRYQYRMSWFVWGPKSLFFKEKNKI